MMNLSMLLFVVAGGIGAYGILLHESPQGRRVKGFLLLLLGLSLYYGGYSMSMREGVPQFALAEQIGIHVFIFGIGFSLIGAATYTAWLTRQCILYLGMTQEERKDFGFVRLVVLMIFCYGFPALMATFVHGENSLHGMFVGNGYFVNTHESFLVCFATLLAAGICAFCVGGKSFPLPKDTRKDLVTEVMVAESS